MCPEAFCGGWLHGAGLLDNNQVLESSMWPKIHASVYGFFGVRGGRPWV